MPNCVLELHQSDSRGRQVAIPALKGSQAVKKLREQSFQVSGPRLFNCLPQSIRNISRVPGDTFKEQLDLFLTKIPDEPNVEGLTPSTCDLFTAKSSNYIIDQARSIKIRRPGA